MMWIVYAVIKIVGVIAVLLPGIAYSVVLERRLSAAVQGRIGPNRVGPQGLLQPAADGLKAILKEEFTPAYARKIYFWLAPTLVLIPSFVVFAVIPFGSMMGAQKMVIADLNIGILFTFAVVSLGVYGIILAGYASNSKYPFLGGVRASAQMISYEIAMGLSVIPIFMIAVDPAFSARIDLDLAWSALLAGTSDLNLNRIIAYQSGSFLDWFVFKQPLAFLIFLVAAFAETNRLPFDMPECETELVSGYHTEYSSMKFALFFLGEYGNMIAASSIMVVLFFGGWSLPIAGLALPASSVGIGVLHIAIFLAKVAMFMVFFIWIRWMLPRFRYDQLMALGWTKMLPLALANIVVTALILWMQH